jgi:hypothetical protein
LKEVIRVGELKLVENMLAAQMVQYALDEIKKAGDPTFHDRRFVEEKIVAAIRILNEKLDEYPNQYTGRRLHFITGHNFQL